MGNGSLRRPAGEPLGPRWESLTWSERTILYLVRKGLTNSQIARQLSVSQHTVSSYVGDLVKKLRGASIRACDSQVVTRSGRRHRVPDPTACQTRK